MRNSAKGGILYAFIVEKKKSIYTGCANRHGRHASITVRVNIVAHITIKVSSVQIKQLSACHALSCFKALLAVISQTKGASPIFEIVAHRANYHTTSFIETQSIAWIATIARCGRTAGRASIYTTVPFAGKT